MTSVPSRGTFWNTCAKKVRLTRRRRKARMTSDKITWRRRPELIVLALRGAVAGWAAQASHIWRKGPVRWPSLSYFFNELMTWDSCLQLLPISKRLMTSPRERLAIRWRWGAVKRSTALFNSSTELDSPTVTDRGEIPGGRAGSSSRRFKNLSVSLAFIASSIQASIWPAGTLSDSTSLVSRLETFRRFWAVAWFCMSVYSLSMLAWASFQSSPSFFLPGGSASGSAPGAGSTSGEFLAPHWAQSHSSSCSPLEPALNLISPFLTVTAFLAFLAPRSI